MERGGVWGCPKNRREGKEVEELKARRRKAGKRRVGV